MTNCKGIFGKWFGHRFQRYLIKSKIPLDPFESCRSVTIENDTNHQLLNIYLDSKRDIYEIRCSRCGCVPEK